MRKTLLTLMFLLLVFFFKPAPLSAADCVQKIGHVCPVGYGIGCYTTSDFCCKTLNDCTQFENESGQPGGRYKEATGPTCSDGRDGFDTAIGCVPFGGSNDSTSIIGFIIRWSIGVGGGIAFLLILYAGFQIMTSSGDPNKLKAGQELLTAAISGLIMLIFSVFILRVIGVDILKIF
ncbi:MAG: pilin [Patescibacteria group bacterium]